MKYTALISFVIVLASTTYADQTITSSFREALDEGGIEAPDSEDIWPLATKVIKTVWETSKSDSMAFDEAWTCTRYLAFCDFYAIHSSNASLTTICNDYRDAFVKYGEQQLNKADDGFKTHSYYGAVAKKALYELKYLYTLFAIDPTEDHSINDVLNKGKADEGANKLTRNIIKEGIARWYEEAKEEPRYAELIQDANEHAKESGTSPKDIE